MKDVLGEFKKKLISIEQAVQRIESDMDIVVAQGASEPKGVLQKLHLAESRVSNVKIFSAMMIEPYDFLTRPEMKGHFEVCSWFNFLATRAASRQSPGTSSYQPGFLRHLTKDRWGLKPPDIFIGTCTPPDKHGYVSLGLGATYEKAMVEKARLVIMEVNEEMPNTFGDTEVYINDIDFFVENHRDLPTVEPKTPDETDRMIARNISGLIEDGSTIQIGIGNIPNAVAEALTNKNDLGIHTEMMPDSMMNLFELGVVTNKRKSLLKGKSACSFVFGTKALYDWVDTNPAVLVLRGEWMNDPSVIRRNSRMVSLNTGLMVDITGQVASEGIGTNQYSGTGGQMDTAEGAREGTDGLGKSIIACHSTAKGGTVSTIVPMFQQGTPVSLHRNLTDYVVTEYGVAWLRGRTVRERVESLIAIAHPEFHDQLREAAVKLKYI